MKIARDDFSVDEQTRRVVGQVVERAAVAAAGRIALGVGNGDREVIGYATGSVARREPKPRERSGGASTMTPLSPAPEYRTKDYKLHRPENPCALRREEGRLDEFVRWGESESKWHVFLIRLP